MNELGELVHRGADVPQIVDLLDRIHEGEYELTQAELGLELAERDFVGEF